MFDAVARRYDLVNDLLSLGQTKRWRKKVQTIINPSLGMKILDIAAGPGSSSEPLFNAGADVTSLDFSEGMLAQGRKARPYLKFVKGDALNLPFDENQFDVTTISFGLRNTHDFKKDLKEALRVTKAATDTGAAAGQVLGASGELSTQSEALGAKGDAFIARIRASEAATGVKLTFSNDTPCTASAHWSGPAGKVMVWSPVLMTRGSDGSFSRPMRVWTPAASSLPLM
jgi:hypothetical protein